MPVPHFPVPHFQSPPLVIDRRTFPGLRSTEALKSENAGVENAGVENAGATKYGKPSDENTLKYGTRQNIS